MSTHTKPLPTKNTTKKKHTRHEPMIRANFLLLLVYRSKHSRKRQGKKVAMGGSGALALVRRPTLMLMCEACPHVARRSPDRYFSSAEERTLHVHTCGKKLGVYALWLLKGMGTHRMDGISSNFPYKLTRKGKRRRLPTKIKKIR